MRGKREAEGIQNGNQILKLYLASVTGQGQIEWFIKTPAHIRPSLADKKE